MTGKKSKDTTEKKVTQEDLRIEQNNMVYEMNKPGTWDDLKSLRTDLKDFPYTIHGMVWKIQYRDIGWGERNQITEELARGMGNNPNAMVYQRKMQEMVIKRRVVFIGDHKMQNEQGEPIATEWHSMPQDLGEFLRNAFFRDTGEVANTVAQGLGYNSIEELKRFVDSLAEAKNEAPDGVQQQDDSLLKK